MFYKIDHLQLYKLTLNSLLMENYILSCKNFKCYTNFSISIPKINILQLDGDSGIGKSTLFDAISFVLYDGLGNSCNPKSKDGSKKIPTTSVTLQWPNGFTILRQRRPNLLKVTTVDGKTIIDESAEHHIINLFGKPSVWKTGGYLRQDELCSFLHMSSRDKLSFLQELSLPDNFEKLLAKNETLITLENEKYHNAISNETTLKNICEYLRNNIGSNLSSPFDRNAFLRYGEIDPSYDSMNINQKVHSIQLLSKNYCSNVINEIQKIDSLLKQKEIQETKYNDLINQKNSLGVLDKNLLLILQQQLTEIQNNIDTKLNINKRNFLSQTRDALNSSLRVIELSGKTLRDLTLLNNMKQIRISTQSNITSEEAMGQLCYIKYEILLKQQTILNRLKELESSTQQYVDVVYKCPKCQVPVYMKSSELCILDFPIVSSTEKINETKEKEFLKKQLSEITMQLQLLSSINSVSTGMKNTLSIQQLLNLLTIPTIEEIEKEIDEHKKINETMRLKKELMKIEDELSKLNCEFTQSSLEIEDLTKTKSQLEIQLNDLKRKTILFDHINSSLLNCKIPDVSNLPSRDLLYQNMKQTEYQLNLQCHLVQYNEKIKELAIATDLKEIISKRLSSLQKIRSTLITAECAILDNTLEIINTTLSQVITQLYDKPISVLIRSLKQLKRDERIKPEINLEINLNGIEYNNIYDMCGGERAKISLALTIAFSKYNKSPFILLDESLKSLHLTSRENAINVLRSLITDKSCIIVNHDTNDDVYDDTLKLK